MTSGGNILMIFRKSQLTKKVQNHQI